MTFRVRLLPKGERFFDLYSQMANEIPAAAAFVGTAVARTVGQAMVDLSVVTHSVILAGLLGAITWNLITWV